MALREGAEKAAPVLLEPVMRIEIVVPGMGRVERGPYRYRWLPHPNYLIVVVEGIALPLVHSAWITAIAFTVLNAILLLKYRIPTEDRALRSLTEP